MKTSIAFCCWVTVDFNSMVAASKKRSTPNAQMIRDAVGDRGYNYSCSFVSIRG